MGGAPMPREKPHAPFSTTIRRRMSTAHVPSAPARSRSTTAEIPFENFVPRHIAPSDDEIAAMLRELGLSSLEELVDKTVPPSIRLKEPLRLHEPRGEMETLAELRQIADKNKVFRSF